mgnify:CR=1 FL=1
MVAVMVVVLVVPEQVLRVEKIMVMVDLEKIMVVVAHRTQEVKEDLVQVNQEKLDLVDSSA